MSLRIGSRSVVLLSGCQLTYTERVKSVFGSSLIAFWSMDESSGTVAVDASGNGYDGTYTDVTLGQSGIGDGKTAPLFNGTSSLVNCGDLSSVMDPDVGTIALWVKPYSADSWLEDAGTYWMLVRSTTQNFYLGKNYRANKASAYLSTPDTTFLETESSLGWVHWAITYSTAERTFWFYRNGIPLSGTTRFAGLPADIGWQVWLGSQFGYNFWNGYLAHALILDREATEVELRKIASLTPLSLSEYPVYSAASSYTTQLQALFGANLIRHFPLNETHGLKVHDSSDRADAPLYAATGITYSQTGIGDGLTSVKLTSSGIGSPYIPDYSYDGDEGSVMIWGRVTDIAQWTNGSEEYMTMINTGTGNKHGLLKSALANRVVYYNSTEAWVEIVAPITPTAGWFHIAVTWSKAANEVKLYFNGAQVGATQTCAGSYSPSPHYVELGHFAGTSRWNGCLAHAALLNRPATSEEIAAAAVVS